MNETFETIANLHHETETRLLVKEVEELLQDRDIGTIFAALVPILVSVNLDRYAHESDEDERKVICGECSATGLTELLQAVRMTHDEIVEGMETTDEE